MSHQMQWRLQRERRKKTAGHPVEGPSPCKVRKISGEPLGRRAIFMNPIRPLAVCEGIIKGGFRIRNKIP